MYVRMYIRAMCTVCVVYMYVHKFGCLLCIAYSVCYGLVCTVHRVCMLCSVCVVRVYCEYSYVHTYVHTWYVVCIACMYICVCGPSSLALLRGVECIHMTCVPGSHDITVICMYSYTLQVIDVM